jgi:2-oxoglutarate ferredoxin oxidoreductase subunit delta
MEVENKLRKASRIFLDDRLCDGCALCVDMCREKVFQIAAEINARGFYISNVVSESSCSGCRYCEFVCPQCAICVIDAEVNGK